MNRLLLLVVSLLGLTLSQPATAFCRATTCDPADPSARCRRDLHSCLLDGAPLHWPSSCLTLNVQSAGSKKWSISAQETEHVLRRALEAWSSVDCDGKAPSLFLQLGERVSCDIPEYNEGFANANVVLYQDARWPYPGSADAYGFTHLRFGAESGQLWDADIEINSAEASLSVGDPVQGADIESILAHELGHVLGLDHTTEVGATMFSSYEEGDDSLRTLEADDVAGMCALYPPERAASTDSCAARFGFSPLCADQQPEPASEPPPSGQANEGGCSVSGGSQSGALMIALLGLGGLLHRRRARP